MFSALFSVRRLSLAIITLMVVTAVAYLVGRQYAEPAAAGDHASPAGRDASSPGAADPTTPGKKKSKQAAPSHKPTQVPTQVTTADPEPEVTPTPSDEPDAPVSPEADQPEPDKDRGHDTEASPAVFANGDRSEGVRELQARLRQVGTFDHDVTGYFGDITAAAVTSFQKDQGLPATGVVDRPTLDALEGVTDEPTADELDNTAAVNEPGPLDERCLTGRVICVDKTSRTVRWVIDGQVLKTMDARFGAPGGFETGEGRFTVQFKSRDHVSSLYNDAPMPFALFFNGGEAVHYSPAFVADGYSGYSHGCVNLRDYDGAAWLFDQVDVGDTVIVYWS